MLQMEFVTELFILDMKEMDPSRAGFGTGSCETVDYHAGHDECDSGKAGDTGKAVSQKPWTVCPKEGRLCEDSARKQITSQNGILQSVMPNTRWNVENSGGQHSIILRLPRG